VLVKTPRLANKEKQQNKMCKVNTNTNQVYNKQITRRGMDRAVKV
jgi:hypothetical protein